MRLVVEHSFAITRDAYESLYFDEPFNAALGDALGLGRELVSLDRTATRIVRVVRCEPRRDPKSPGGQAFGKSRASFVEHIDYDRATRIGAWKTVPNVFPDRVRSTGTLELVADGAGVKRTVRAEVVVRAFGFGGRIEKLIAHEIEQSYAKSAVFTTEWLARLR